jgi:hypothetical protein
MCHDYFVVGMLEEVACGEGVAQAEGLYTISQMTIRKVVIGLRCIP